jgi:tetratricopeptide (TPR) repeat protein
VAGKNRRTRGAAWVSAIAAAILLSARLSGSGPAAGRPSVPTEAVELRRHGLELGYNLDHASALAAFQEAIAADPGEATSYRLAAAVAWIQILFEQGSITVADYLGEVRSTVTRPKPSAALDAAFHTNIQHALELAERRLRRFPDDASAHFQVGAAYGFLASYAATVDGRVIGGFGLARRAYRENERALELDPARHDAGLIVGMYRYAVADLPAPMHLVARLAGFASNRADGLRLVEAAARHPSDVQANALFTLILIYNREARYDDALRVIAELQQRFPRNRLLWLEAGQTLLRAGRAAAARDALEAGLEQMSTERRPLAHGEEARWRFAHGASLVELKQAGAAERELRAALALSTHDWLRGRIHKELGKLHDLAGDRANAISAYRLAEGLCRKGRDGDCSVEVKVLIKAPYR